MTDYHIKQNQQDNYQYRLRIVLRACEPYFAIIGMQVGRTIETYKQDDEGNKGRQSVLKPKLALPQRLGGLKQAPAGALSAGRAKASRVQQSGSESPTRFKLGNDDYGFLGIQGASPEVARGGLYVGHSTGALGSPGRAGKSDRGSLKDQRKSYINYADASLSDGASLGTGRAGLVAALSSPSPARDSVKVLKRRTVEQIEGINKLIEELKSKGGDREGRKRPPLPDCFQRKVPSPKKPTIDLIAMLKLSFGDSAAVKEEFERICLRRGAEGSKDAGKEPGSNPDGTGKPPISPARKKELILEKKARKEAAAALKQQRDPFAHFFGVVSSQAPADSQDGLLGESSVKGSPRRVNFADQSSASAHSPLGPKSSNKGDRTSLNKHDGNGLSPTTSNRGPGETLQASPGRSDDSHGLLGEIKMLETAIQDDDSDSEEEPEIEDDSSASDDKTQPNFWRRTGDYDALPEHVKKAIEYGQLNAKHSQFYYRMKDLNQKIAVYRQIFDSRIPSYQRAFMKRQLLNKQVKQQKARLAFEREMREIKKNERMNLKRFQTAVNVVAENTMAGRRTDRRDPYKQHDFGAGSVMARKKNHKVMGNQAALAEKGDRHGVEENHTKPSPPPGKYLSLAAGREHGKRLTSKTVNMATSEAGSRASRRDRGKYPGVNNRDLEGDDQGLSKIGHIGQSEAPQHIDSSAPGGQDAAVIRGESSTGHGPHDEAGDENQSSTQQNQQARGPTKQSNQQDQSIRLDQSRSGTASREESRILITASQMSRQAYLRSPPTMQNQVGFESFHHHNASIGATDKSQTGHSSLSKAQPATNTNKEDGGTTGPLIEVLEEEASANSNITGSRPRLQNSRLHGAARSGKSSTRSLKAIGSQQLLAKEHHQRSSGSLIKSNPADNLNEAQLKIKVAKQLHSQKKVLTPINQNIEFLSRESSSGQSFRESDSRSNVRRTKGTSPMSNSKHSSPRNRSIAGTSSRGGQEQKPFLRKQSPKLAPGQPKNILKKNINLAIKKVSEQITEEHPGDDVSPGMRFKSTGRFSALRKADVSDSRPEEAEEARAVRLTQIKEQPDASQDDSNNICSTGRAMAINYQYITHHTKETVHQSNENTINNNRNNKQFAVAQQKEKQQNAKKRSTKPRPGVQTSTRAENTTFGPISTRADSILNQYSSNEAKQRKVAKNSTPHDLLGVFNDYTYNLNHLKKAKQSKTNFTGEFKDVIDDSGAVLAVRGGIGTSNPRSQNRNAYKTANRSMLENQILWQGVIAPRADRSTNLSTLKGRSNKQGPKAALNQKPQILQHAPPGGSRDQAASNMDKRFTEVFLQGHTRRSEFASQFMEMKTQGQPLVHSGAVSLRASAEFDPRPAALTSQIEDNEEQMTIQDNQNRANAILEPKITDAMLPELGGRVSGGTGASNDEMPRRILEQRSGGDSSDMLEATNQSQSFYADPKPQTPKKNDSTSRVILPVIRRSQMDQSEPMSFKNQRAMAELRHTQGPPEKAPHHKLKQIKIARSLKHRTRQQRGADGGRTHSLPHNETSMQSNFQREMIHLRGRMRLEQQGSRGSLSSILTTLKTSDLNASTTIGREYRAQGLNNSPLRLQRKGHHLSDSRRNAGVQRSKNMTVGRIINLEDCIYNDTKFLTHSAVAQAEDRYRKVTRSVMQ